jgi:hypothetical protein
MTNPAKVYGGFLTMYAYFSQSSIQKTNEDIFVIECRHRGTNSGRDPVLSQECVVINPELYQQVTIASKELLVIESRCYCHRILHRVPKESVIVTEAPLGV